MSDSHVNFITHFSIKKKNQCKTKYDSDFFILNGVYGTLMYQSDVCSNI